MKNSKFTLIEIVIAIAILALACGSIVGMLGHARQNMMRAQEKWGIQHAMEQATEYFLMANPEDLTLIDGLLPVEYSAECTIEAVGDELPDEMAEPYRGWILARYIISVFNQEGELMGQNIVFKIVREDEI